MLRSISSIVALPPLLAACGPLIDQCYSCIGNDPNAVLSPEQQAKVVLIDSPRRLPASARNVRYYEECGIDCFQMLSFEAPLAEARHFANGLVEAPIAAGRTIDPAGPSTALDWWPKSWPAGVESGENDASTGKRPFVIVAVLPQGATGRVWLRAFNM